MTDAPWLINNRQRLNTVAWSNVADEALHASISTVVPFDRVRFKVLDKSDVPGLSVPHDDDDDDGVEELIKFAPLDSMV